MSNYRIFGIHYDAFMDFASYFYRFMDRVSSRYTINTESVLEIACGTGRNLQYFKTSQLLCGLDISPEMLNSAKLNTPEAIFIQQDMTDFQIGLEFDLVLCMFDSINHLIEYSKWISTFQSVVRHLKPNGYFIFDINTPFALNMPTIKRTMFRQSNDDYLIMQYYNSGIDQAIWDLHFFIQQEMNKYLHYSESIVEASFNVELIKDDLLSVFSSVDMFNDMLEAPNENEQRVFFICKK